MIRAAPALALVLALLPRVALAASTPDPATLRAMLIDAPSGYVEADAGPDTVDGPFDAQAYVETSFSDQHERDDIKAALTSRGFVGGYGRTFAKEADQAWIIEDVKAFPDVSHASSYWGWEKGYFHDASDPATEVSTPIPSSFGNQYVADGFYGIQIEFPKGSFVYTMVVGSYKGYMPVDANAEAVAEYRWAPAGETEGAVSAPSALPALTAAVVVVGSTAGAVAVIVLAAMIAMLVISLRRRRDYSPRNILSADGAYWWDGRAWQPTVPTR